MCGDDEDLGRPLAVVPPAVPVSGGNARGVAALEIVDLLFKRQFYRPVKVRFEEE
jgi:hypothetical protein